jgi:hypothetical protein
MHGAVYGECPWWDLPDAPSLKKATIVNRKGKGKKEHPTSDSCALSALLLFSLSPVFATDRITGTH